MLVFCSSQSVRGSNVLFSILVFKTATLSVTSLMCATSFIVTVRMRQISEPKMVGGRVQKASSRSCNIAEVQSASVTPLPPESLQVLVELCKSTYARDQDFRVRFFSLQKSDFWTLLIVGANWLV